MKRHSIASRSLLGRNARRRAPAAQRRSQTRGGRSGGFTLIEVMLALAILAIGLTMLIKGTANSIKTAEDSRMDGIVTTLARGKMLDVEEKLLKDGFQETEQGDKDQDFGDEGWPNIAYDVEVLPVKLPSLDQLAAMAKASAEQEAAAASAGSGSGSGSSLIESSSGGGLLGMMSMLGGDMSAEDANAAGQMPMMYGIIQQVLEVAIRKVRLTVRWKVFGFPRELVIVQYVTDPGAMNRVIGGIGAAGAGDYGTDGVDPPPPVNP